jgi:hypothetical protein
MVILSRHTLQCEAEYTIVIREGEPDNDHSYLLSIEEL